MDITTKLAVTEHESILLLQFVCGGGEMTTTTLKNGTNITIRMKEDAALTLRNLLSRLYPVKAVNGSAKQVAVAPEAIVEKTKRKGRPAGSKNKSTQGLPTVTSHKTTEFPEVGADDNDDDVVI